MSEIPTPRTDAAIKEISTGYYNSTVQTVSPDFARELERENVELREALKPFAEFCVKNGIASMRGRNGAILTESDWLKTIPEL